jgi:hypothetical protein
LRETEPRIEFLRPVVTIKHVRRVMFKFWWLEGSFVFFVFFFPLSALLLSYVVLLFHQMSFENEFIFFALFFFSDFAVGVHLSTRT